MSENAQKAFAKLDENGDGFITKDEAEAVLLARGIKYDRASLHADFDALDANKNGKLSFDEFKKISEEPYKSRYAPLFQQLLG